jgi:hypothetical protein
VENSAKKCPKITDIYLIFNKFVNKNVTNKNIKTTLRAD